MSAEPVPLPFNPTMARADRIGVPGGWWYILTLAAGGATSVFVPNPDPPTQKNGPTAGPQLAAGWRAEQWRTNARGDLTEITAWRLVDVGQIECAVWWLDEDRWLVSRGAGRRGSPVDAQAPPLLHP